MRGISTKLLISLIAGLLLTSGCERKIDSINPVRNLPQAPPVPFNLVSQIYDRAIMLSWDIRDSASVDLYRIHMADEIAGTYNVIASTATRSYLVEDLPYDRSVWLRVDAINQAGIESALSEPINVQAGLLSMAIANGNEYTRNRGVVIRLDVPAPAAYIQIDEDPLLIDVPIRNYSSQMSFELSDGDGTKTVYALVTFADGSEAGEIISDEVVLDRAVRIDSVYFAPEGPFGVGDTIHFYVAAGETEGEAGVTLPELTEINLFDDGGPADQSAGDGIYSATFIVPVGLIVANGVVTGSFRDAAGNVATDAIAVDRLDIQSLIPPDPVILSVGLTDSVTTHLSWTQNDDSDFASYRIYRSVSPGINVGDDHLMVAIISDHTMLAHDDYISGASIYYYRVFVFDIEGLNTGSNEVVISR